MPGAQSVSATCRKQVPPTLPSRHLRPIARTKAGGTSMRPTSQRFNEPLVNWPHPAKLHRLLGLGVPLTIDERKAGVARLSFAVPVVAGESITSEDDQREYIAESRTPGDIKLPEDLLLGHARLDMVTPELDAIPQRSVHDSEDFGRAHMDGLDQATNSYSSSDERIWLPNSTESPAQYDPGAIEAVRNTIQRLESDLVENTELLTREREDVRRLQEDGQWTNAARQEVMRLERNAWEFRNSINGLRRSFGNWL